MIYPMNILPKDDRAYHIDAIGSISRNRSSPSNHIVDLYASPIDNQAYAPLKNIQAAFRPEKQKVLTVSVGEFFGFQAGCVVRNGRIESRPQQPNFEVKLHINKENTQYITPREFLRPEDRSPYELAPPVIPQSLTGFGVHPLSKLVAIRRGDDPYSLLVPPIELVRFYHCCSSKLNQVLFTSDITRMDRIVNLKKTWFDADRKKLKLTLRKEFPNEDALIIGRWICDETYYKSAHAIWNHLVTYAKSGDTNHLPLEATFPFEGKTTLSGYGVILPTPDFISEKRILVLSLLHCSHESPFDHLIVERETPPGAGESELSEVDGGSSEPRRRPPRHPNPEDNPQGVNDPFSNPSGYFDTKLFRIPSDRFNHVDVTFECSVSDRERSRYGGEIEGDPAPNQSSSEKTSGGTNSQQISVVPAEKLEEDNSGNEKERDPLLPADFSTFVAVCAELKNHDGISSISDLTIDEAHNSPHDAVSQFDLPKKGETRRWPLIITGDGGVRARQFMLREIDTPHGPYYLLYIERKHCYAESKSEYFTFYIFRDCHFARIKLSFIKVLLNDLSMTRFSGYRSEFRAKGLRVTSIKHSSNTRKMSAFICNAIERISKPEKI